MTNPVLLADPSENETRRLWLAVATAAGCAGSVATAVPFKASLAPIRTGRALGAPVDADARSPHQGEPHTGEWPGDPAFVLRRMPDVIKALAQHDALLDDPQPQRSEQPQADPSA